MFIYRILPSRSPRLNVIGQDTNCSPITGLWMYAMGDSGVLHPCVSYIGVNVDDYTICHYRCDTGGLVNYIVLGMSDRRASSTSDTAVICDIAIVWGPSPILYKGWLKSNDSHYSFARENMRCLLNWKIFVPRCCVMLIGPCGNIEISLLWGNSDNQFVRPNCLILLFSSDYAKLYTVKMIYFDILCSVPDAFYVVNRMLFLPTWSHCLVILASFGCR